MTKAHVTMNRNASIHLAICGLLGLVTIPSIGSATAPAAEEPTPMLAEPDCDKAQIQLEFDVATGNVYEVDPNTGNLTLIDNDIDAYFGSLGHVVVVLHYSSSNWNVTITPEGKSPVTYRTTNGWLRYSISDEIGKYTFVSTPQSTMSAMSSMTPVVPDVIIRPKPDCPPSP